MGYRHQQGSMDSRMEEVWAECRKNFDQTPIYHVMLHGVMNEYLQMTWHMPNHRVRDRLCSGSS